MKHEITVTTPVNDTAAMSVINAAKESDGSFERVARDDENYQLTFRFDNDKDAEKFTSQVTSK